MCRNHVPAAALAEPPLTTVKADLGDDIADSIRRRLDGRTAARRPGSDIHAVIARAAA